MTKQSGNKPKSPEKSMVLAFLGAVVIITALVLGTAWLGEGFINGALVVAFIGFSTYKMVEAGRIDGGRRR